MRLVTDGEDVSVIARQCANDAVLVRVEILELVHQQHAPPRANLCRGTRFLE